MSARLPAGCSPSQEGTASAPYTVLVSAALAERRFGRSEAAVGKALAIAGMAERDVSATIVGVVPSTFRFIDAADMWIPMRRGEDDGPETRRFHNWILVGRVRPGVTMTALQGQIDVVARRLQQQYPETNKVKGLRVDPLQATLLGQRSLAALTATDLRFDTRNLLATTIEVPYEDVTQRLQFQAAVHEGLAAIPGVTAVTFTSHMPFLEPWGDPPMYAAIRPPTDASQEQTALERWVPPGFFKAMGIRALSGRDLSPADRIGTQLVMVVNDYQRLKILMRSTLPPRQLTDVSPRWGEERGGRSRSSAPTWSFVYTRSLIARWRQA